MPNTDTPPSPLPADYKIEVGAAGSPLFSATVESAASVNATLVKASPGDVYEISLTNYSAAAKFFKFYDKASAPTVGTDTPCLTIALAANSEKVYGFGSFGKRFARGIAYAITNLQSVADATAVGADDVVGAFSYI
jgi:hypothetical protein